MPQAALLDAQLIAIAIFTSGLVVSMPQAALLDAQREQQGRLDYASMVFQCRKRHCLMRNAFEKRPFFVYDEEFQCRKRHCLMRNSKRGRSSSMTRMFQCRKRHCLMRNLVMKSALLEPAPVSMPQAALLDAQRDVVFFKATVAEVSMPQAALLDAQRQGRGGTEAGSAAVSMPQAALLDAQQEAVSTPIESFDPFQCRKRHCLMRNALLNRFPMANCYGFQCRKRHCLMRNSKRGANLPISEGNSPVCGKLYLRCAKRHANRRFRGFCRPWHPSAPAEVAVLRRRKEHPPPFFSWNLEHFLQKISLSMKKSYPRRKTCSKINKKR